MSNKNKEAIKEVVEETVIKVPFEKQLESAVEENKNHFYQGILKQADEKIISLNDQLEKMQNNQLEFRDEIAMHCFIPLIPVTNDYKKAASDAYRAADAFLRVRESGDEIIS